MCGIAGFIDYKYTSNKEILQKCTDSLAHRGPDGSGHEFFQTDQSQIGLGQRRLSIIDLTEGGKQPMNFRHYWIIFNGEIYNYQEIKDTLSALGHTFISHSDTEMMLHAFEEWGIKCINKFIGMFAFVIYDTQKEEIFCVRDRAGVKPFFYYWANGLFLFSSELKSFHQHPAFKKELNVDAVAAFMQYGYVPTPHCIFKNTHKLAPAHWLKFDLKKQHIQVEKYWDVYDYYNQLKLDISFEEAKTETEKVLSKAFNYRMVADVPVGVFLSGGYDSTCVTALLQKDSATKIKTYTIGVEDEKLDEAPYAKIIAKHLGTDHTEHYCTEKEALDIVPMLPFYYDEPFGDYSAIPTTLVSKIAREHVTVALSADAGDEVFAGYNRYDYWYKYGKKIGSIPSPVRSIIGGIMHVIPANYIPIMGKHPHFGQRYEKIKALIQDPSVKNLLTNLSSEYNTDSIKSLFKSPPQYLDTYFNRSLNPKYDDGLSYMMAVDYQTYLLDDILQKVDRATMSVSLEGREPFLDQNVIEWAAKIPTEYKYNKGQKKYIVKEIVHQYIPKSMMDRPKMGFAIPIEKWLRHELKDILEQCFDEKMIATQGIFNIETTTSLKKSFLMGKPGYAMKVWYFMMFQMWYKQWMN
jgi:asparagine synthase (glutamine-hydrolysing)